MTARKAAAAACVLEVVATIVTVLALFAFGVACWSPTVRHFAGLLGLAALAAMLVAAAHHVEQVARRARDAQTWGGVRR